MKRNELLIHMTTWGNLESIMQSINNSDTQDYNIIPFLFSSRKKYRDREQQISNCQRLGDRGGIEYKEPWKKFPG